MTINKLLDSKQRSTILSKHSTRLYLGWVLFIALVTLIPGKAIPDFINWNFLSLDKLIHFILFFVLSFLGSYSFAKAGQSVWWRSILISFFLAIFYGTLIEYLQTLIPDRSFDYADLTANCGGALVGSLFYWTRTKT